MDRKTYKNRLKSLQKRLTLLQQAYARQGLRGVIVFEGWDASGKGGIIRRLAWALDPRRFRVWSTGAPNEIERRQHWLQRFWARLPESGELAAFDRSWYGRVLVERVEGLATPEEWRRAYDEIVQFEEMLLAEDFRIVKLFLDITPETQLKRFRNRYETPSKRWKMTEDDIRNRARRDDYAAAYADMFRHCSTGAAPWRRIEADKKRPARLEALQTVLDVLGEGVEVSAPPVPVAVEAFFGEMEGRVPARH
ncbi:MAG: polyphosphate kinase 2 family protein [Alphaproteobacteria bacterium]